MYEELPDGLAFALAPELPVAPTLPDAPAVDPLRAVEPVVPTPLPELVAVLRAVLLPGDVAVDELVVGDSVLVDALARMNEGIVGVVARDLLADEVAVLPVPLVPTAAFCSDGWMQPTSLISWFSALCDCADALAEVWRVLVCDRVVVVDCRPCVLVAPGVEPR